MVVYTSLLNVSLYKRYWEMETQRCVCTVRLCSGDLAADVPGCCSTPWLSHTKNVPG